VAIRVNFPWVTQIVREPGETDEQLRKRAENHHKRRILRDFLGKLGLKSVHGQDTAFKWGRGPIHKPGVYSNVRVDAPDFVER
jgi:hypothetical protein